MITKIKKTFVVILSLLFLCMFGISPGAVFAAYPGTTNLSFASYQTAAMVGNKENYYLGVGLTGSGTYISPYSIVYLKKDLFDKPTLADINETTASAGSIQSKEIDESDPNYYKVKITYYSVTGSAFSNVITLTLKDSMNFKKGDTFSVKSELYSSDNVKIGEKTNTFHTDTQIAGVDAADTSMAYDIPYYTDYFNLTTANISGGFIKPSYVTWAHAVVNNGKKNTTNWGITATSVGRDKRKVRTVLKLPNYAVWNPSAPSNDKWTYDPVAKTITNDQNWDNYGILSIPFSLSCQAGTVAATTSTYGVPLEQTNYLVNDDGTIDTSTERKGTYYLKYSSGVAPVVIKGLLYGGDYSTNNTALWERESEHLWVIDFKYPIQVTDFNEIVSLTDRPVQKLIFTQCELRADNVLNIWGQKSAAETAYLVGINDDGTEETVADPMPIVWSTARSVVLTNPVTIPKYYRALKVKFHQNPKIKGSNQYVFSLVIKAKVHPDEYGRIEGELNDPANITNPYSHPFVTNLCTMRYKSGGVEFDKISNESRLYFAPENAAIGMKLNKAEVIQSDGTIKPRISNNPRIAKSGEKLKLDIHLLYKPQLKSPREVKDAKLIFLTPMQMNFDGAESQIGNLGWANFGSYPYDIVYNYKGTGKKAFIFPISSLILPAENSEYYIRDKFNFYFKPESTLPSKRAPGYDIDAILSWSNTSPYTYTSEPGIVYALPQQVDGDGIDYPPTKDINDANNNGDTNERLAFAHTTMQFDPPAEVIISKYVRNVDDSSQDAFAPKRYVDSDDTVEYQVNMINNNTFPANDLIMLDILPYPGDKRIVEDNDGVRKPRGSKFKVSLAGAVEQESTRGGTTHNDDFTIYYSHDTPGATFNDDVMLASWSTSPGDLSTVTMIKAVQKPGTTYLQGEGVTFKFKGKASDTSALPKDSSSFNSAAFTDGTKKAEILQSELQNVKYEVKGKAYIDDNLNGIYDSGEEAVANRPVILIDKDTGNELQQSTTDSTGNYTFPIGRHGNYSVLVELIQYGDTSLNIERATIPRISTLTDVCNDFSSYTNRAPILAQPHSTVRWAQLTDITLTRTSRNAVRNLGIVDPFADVKVEYRELVTENELAPHLDLGRKRAGTPYQTDPLSIQYYDVVTPLPANKDGLYAENPLTNNLTTIIYHYKRGNSGGVHVMYKDVETGLPVESDEFLDGTGKLGLPYTTVQKVVPNYNFDHVDGETSGIFEVGMKEVTYWYQRKDAANITVKYLEEDTDEELAPQEVFDGRHKLGLECFPVKKDILNFDFTRRIPAENVHIYFTENEQTIIYYYRRKNAGDITVKYLEEETDAVLAPEEHFDGSHKLGLECFPVKKSIPLFGFTRRVPDETVHVYFTEGSQTVIYYYERGRAGDVEVNYVEQGTGVVLAPQVILDGRRKLGLPYTTERKQIENFNLVKIPDNADGIFVEGRQVVTYEYERKNAGDVEVNYLEEGTNAVLAPQEILDGTHKLGLPYTTIAKEVQWYELVGIPDNATGIFLPGRQVVNYYYKRGNAGDVEVRYIDEADGSDLHERLIIDGTGKLGLPYTTTPITIEYYELTGIPDNATGIFLPGRQEVVYVYRRKDAGDVIAHYVDHIYRTLEPDEILDGTRKLGLPWHTYPKYIEGYHLIRVEGAEEGVFLPGTQEVTYVYFKDPSIIIIPPKIPGRPPSTVIIPPKTPTSPPRTATPSTPSIATPSTPGGGGRKNPPKKRERRPTPDHPLNPVPKIPPDTPDVPNTPYTPDTPVNTPPPDERVPLPVPRTEDCTNLLLYQWIFIICSILCIRMIFYKKKDE